MIDVPVAAAPVRGVELEFLGPLANRGRRASCRERDLALLLVAILPACSSTPVGTGQIPEGMARTAKISQPPIEDYHLAPGDHLEFRVIDSTDPADMDTVQQVRADGRITLPMIDDQVVSGLTLQEARKMIQKQYVDRKFLTANAANGVNLIIKESAANRFYVGGQVKKEGAFTYSHPTTVMRAIFEAGGMADTADPTRVVMIRQDGTYQVVDVKSILAGNFKDDPQLRPMDSVYVPTSTIGDIDTFIQLYIKNVLPISPGVSVGF